MLDAWSELPAWLRLVTGLIVMLAGGVVLWLGITGRIMAGRRMVFYGAFGLIGLGFGMLVLGGKTDSEKNGYHF